MEVGFSLQSLEHLGFLLSQAACFLLGNLRVRQRSRVRQKSRVRQVLWSDLTEVLVFSLVSLWAH